SPPGSASRSAAGPTTRWRSPVTSIRPRGCSTGATPRTSPVPAWRSWARGGARPTAPASPPSWAATRPRRRPPSCPGRPPATIRPRGQERLWRAVASAGVLLSEAPLGGAPERWRYPARNRVIAALADVVVVVESHRRGGSLHTVDEADRRGVEVMAVPGSVRNPAAAGTNELLAEGCPPACSADDVLVALGLTAARRSSGSDRRALPSPDDRRVLDAVGWQPVTL